MKVEVRVARSFKRDAKPLIKKYPSFLDDLEKLELELLKKPTLGDALGNNTFKIRLKITSKGKGKSGGTRVISYVINEIIGKIEIDEENQLIVNLIAVYDKSERASITTKELKELIQNLE
jgi:mRNA-degrading endonuclease RelE of RelBE toxin-antitoxin system